MFLRIKRKHSAYCNGGKLRINWQPENFKEIRLLLCWNTINSKILSTVGLTSSIKILIKFDWNLWSFNKGLIFVALYTKSLIPHHFIYIITNKFIFFSLVDFRHYLNFSALGPILRNCIPRLPVGYLRKFLRNYIRKPKLLELFLVICLLFYSFTLTLI